VRIKKEDKDGREAIAQYIMRNVFKNVPSLTWRECIKKIWKDDPLICPECSSVMKIISFIEKPQIIKKILKYLNLWEEESARDPPVQSETPVEIVYVPIDDGWEQQNAGFAG